jgi:hypothetical protein
MWSAYRHFLGHVAVHDPVTMTVATVAGGAIQAAGTLMGGSAAADAGGRQQQAQYFKAEQEEQAAQESRASHSALRWTRRARAGCSSPNYRRARLLAVAALRTRLFLTWPAASRAGANTSPCLKCTRVKTGRGGLRIRPLVPGCLAMRPRRRARRRKRLPTSRRRER